ncbi:MAG: phosphotransferase family protein [Candidatus Heimdallarchaeaceae archaeon]
MILSEKQIEKLNKKIRHYFHFSSSVKLKWQKMEKGLSNTKFLIESKDNSPLAVCKIYEKDQAIPAEKRLQNEKKALELFGGKIAPELIWTDNSKILCYNYIIGTEITNLTNEERKNIEEEFRKTVDFIHSYSNKNFEKTKKQFSKLQSFYFRIFDNYEKMNLSVPEYMSAKIPIIKNKLKNLYEILQSEGLKVSYIHGDLVPLNIIVNGNQVSLIDFEYFRMDISIFDDLYFNYFSDKHQLNIELPVISVNKEIQEVYEELIQLLNNYWLFSKKL